MFAVEFSHFRLKTNNLQWSVSAELNESSAWSTSEVCSNFKDTSSSTTGRSWESGMQQMWPWLSPGMWSTEVLGLWLSVRTDQSWLASCTTHTSPSCAWVAFGVKPSWLGAQALQLNVPLNIAEIGPWVYWYRNCAHLNPHPGTAHPQCSLLSQSLIIRPVTLSEGSGWPAKEAGVIARRDERGHFAHHPSKPLMFVPGKRTPRPALVSSYVAGNRIKSSHSSPR